MWLREVYHRLWYFLALFVVHVSPQGILLDQVIQHVEATETTISPSLILAGKQEFKDSLGHWIEKFPSSDRSN
ncbi:hypothetical protein BR93DRAFT_201317 [Coniochaeta sp. PMI_546]|nr:hypothetical protein BR93DRAFT_201317 [Coniochaeta sp. PMI_546]